MTNPPNFEIIVGTYEEFLLGYRISQTNNDYKMTQSFATHSHSSSIRCVTSSGRYVASGAADDRIIIYDMKTRKEHCMLDHHNSTINSVEITPHQTHVVSVSSDGVLAIVRVGNWKLEKIWEKPHKGSSVDSLAIHPTGKLALTLGSDHTLRTWNLIKGRQAYAINLTTKSADPKSLDCVKWSPCGENFSLSGGLNLEIWNITSGGILNKFQYTSRVTSVWWINENILSIGHEDGNITLLNLKKEKQRTAKAHTMRVKCLQSFENWLVSCSSDGHIKLWEFDGKKITEMSDCSTGCRCTSMALVSEIVKQEENQAPEVDGKQSSDEEDVSGKTTFKNDKGCKVVIEEEVEKNSKKRKKNRNKSNSKKSRKDV